MRNIFVNIAAETVTINNETCDFRDAGLYNNADGDFSTFTDQDEIAEALEEKYDGQEIEVVFT